MGERDRPAKNPGGMQCENCDEIFIGEPWHAYCATCQSWFDAKERDAAAQRDMQEVEG